MKARTVALGLVGLLAVGSLTGVGTSDAQAHGWGYRGYYRPRSYGYRAVPPRGYYYGSSYYGGGRYGRPWGYSSSFGYFPGYGSYFGSSYYGRGFGYSSYGGYFR
jgi:hypothetical protein